MGVSLETQNLWEAQNMEGTDMGVYSTLDHSSSVILEGPKRNLQLEVYKYFLRQNLGQNRQNDAFMTPSPQDGKTPPKNQENQNKFYEQFKPMFILLILFGRLSIRRNKDRYEWKYVSWLMLYCVINYSLQTYLAMLVFLKRLNALRDSKRNYDELIFSIHVMAYLQIHYHVPFTYWTQGTKLSEYLNIWKTFQDDWFLTFGEELQLGYKRHVRWFTSITIPSVILLLCFEKYSTLLDPWLYLLPHFFTIASTMLIIGLWYCTCLEIKRLSKIMTTHLTNNLKTRPNAMFLQHWRHLWVSLSSLCSCLGSHLAAIVISIVFTFSLTFLLGLYNALSHIISLNVSWKTLGYLLASMLSLLIIYAFIDAGQKGSSEVNFLIEAIRNDPPQIDLGGFVTMNRHLFIGFVSNTLTYLIVILQFKFN